MQRRRKKTTAQSGFTLIELMVVLVVMAVVVSVGIMSFASLNQDAVSSQKNRIQQYLKQVSDEAAFKQKLLLVIPDEKGLTAYSKVNVEWQADAAVESYRWPEHLNAEWVLDETLVERQRLPGAGWMFWPNGDVVEGKIVLQMKADREETASIEWNTLLVFMEPEESYK